LSEDFYQILQISNRYAPNGSVWLRCILKNVEFWTKVKAKGMDTTTKNITMSGGKKGKKKN
jgi:hypothetical protein